MIELSTKVIRQLGFMLFNKPAIIILSEYLDYNYQKLSIQQQIMPLTKFLVYIHTECLDVLNSENVNKYISVLFSKTYSTAQLSKTFIKQFVTYLHSIGVCDQIKLSENEKSKSKKTFKYYDVFEIDKNASEKEIKKAYHRLALKFHPDINKDKNASKMFASIVHIYKILSDEKERFEYDVTMGYVDGYVTERKKSYYSVQLWIYQ